MQGDDLVISLFFFSSAVLAGYEAMKATGWRVWAFWIITGAFVACGFGWHWLKDVSPTLAKWVGDIATSPQSWFVLIVLGLVLLSITGRKARKDGAISGDGYPDLAAQIKDIDQRLDEIWNNIGSIDAKLTLIQNYDDNDLRRHINDVMQKQALLEAQFKQALPTSEQVRNLNRTAFLVSTAAVEAMYESRLKEALDNCPEKATDFPIDTDEKMIRETGRINEYLADVAANLSGSCWFNELARVIKNAELDADSELLRMTVPTGLHSARHRLFFIASLCVSRTKSFLERSIAEAKKSSGQILQMLNERPTIHK